MSPEELITVSVLYLSAFRYCIPSC